ncbi:iron ABC transporter permease [Reinekea thalattae]|uniref:Iron ABC transporter permease n=1 Tax=Reinekea thalattae TaxID=2593301 RepID=A0A5C8Z7A2_9GAMM|nr:iron ABC transporter permease [Reinekea thalattae]TXR53173.1 iron ABC transporter permease [Reinekea thalattae]
MIKSLSIGGVLLLALLCGYLFFPPVISNTSLATAMFNNVWLPTALMALLTGALLGSSGLLIQTSLDNDFASPSTLGIAAGSLLGALLVRIIMPEASLTIVWTGALIGALFLSLAVLSLSHLIGGGKLPVILIGMTLGLSAGALSSLLILYFENQIDGLFLWGSGQVLQTSFTAVQQSFTPIIISLLLTVFIFPKLALFLLGDTHAANLGLAVKPWRWLVLLLALVQAALATSIVGMIGFVGLMAPHITRLLLNKFKNGGGNMGFQWLLTIIVGAMLVLLAEWCSRSLLFLGYRLPTGAFTALLGAPYFIYLLFQRSGRLLAATERQNISLRPLLHISANKTLIALFLLLLFTIYVCSEPLGNVGSTWINKRVILAGLGGLGLACAGTLLQTLFKNPMASPDISGVSAFAVFIIACVLVIFPSANHFILIIAALIGAGIVIGLLTWGLNQQLSVAQLALFGIVITAFSGTATQILLTFGTSTSSVTMMWMAGTTYGASTERIVPLAIVLIVAGALIIPFIRNLDLMPLGEILPRTLGVSLNGQRTLLLAITAVLTAICIATIGAISFVGLLAPHCARLLGLYRHVHLLPASAMTGAILLMYADHLSRTLMYPNEIPAGLLVSVIGSLYFLLLLFAAYRKRK